MAVVVRQNIVGGEVAPLVRLDRRRRRLSAVVKRHAPKARPYMVSVHRRGQLLRPTDDTVRMRATWSQTLVGADDAIVITYLPLGGGAQGNAQAKQIGGAIALIALAVAAPYALGAIAPALFAAGSFATAAATAGIVAGGAYLVGKITQPKANPAADDPSRPLYGVSGGGNLPRPGDRIPVGYGHFWTQPDLSQPDYSIYDGEDMLLYKRQTLGLGKYQVHSIQLGTATLWTEADGVVAPFSGDLGGDGVGLLGRGIGGGASGSGGGTEVEIINPGETSSLVPGSVYSSPSVGGTELPRVGENPSRAGPFRASPVGKQTSRIQIDWSAPQGVSHGDGASAIGIQIRYAPCDDDDQPTGAWQDLYVFGVTAHTTRGHRFTAILDVPAGDYIVDGQNTIPLVEGHINAVTWDGLRSHYAETIVRPHVTEIAIKIRSGKSLGVTAFGDLWVEATRILPVWNGSAWVEQATRKAVYAFKDIMQADYGAGLADAEVDLARVKFYDDELSEHDTFDGVIRGPVSVWEAAASVLGPMRAEPARIANTWSINRDEPREVQKHHITRRQIVRNTTAAAFKIARDDGAADVIAEYAPDGDPRRRRDLRVTFGAPSITPSRIQLIGVTSHEHAHHIATWKAVAAYLRRERRRITLDRRGRILARGDTARIDAWFMTSARAAGILARDGLVLTLDAPVEVGGATYTTLRDRQGREWGPVKVTAETSPAREIELDADDVAAIEADLLLDLDDAIARDDQEMTSLLVGPLAELQDSYLIDSVQPQGRDRVAIEALFDHPGVWDALGEAPPAEPLLPSLGDVVETAVPVVPWLRARCVQKGVALEMEWAIGQARGASSYVVSISYDDGEAYEIASNGLSTSGSYALRHVEGVPVRVAAYAVSRFGVPGPAVYFEFTTFKPAINLDTSDLLVVQEALGRELDGYVRQVIDQFPRYIAELREGLGQVAGALGDQVAALRETHGRSLISIGERYLQNSASIEQVAIAFADADTAIAALITTLTATVGGNTAAISAEATARANADTAISSTVTALTATVGGNTAAISAEATARANADTAIAGTVTALTTTVNGNTAAISAETLARSSGDSSLAGRIEAFLATSGSGTAEGKIRFIAASAPSGVVATFAVEVNVSTSGAASWQPSGIYLDAMVGFSRIRLVANQIKLSDPGIASGAPFDMFTVAAGIATLNGALYVQSLTANSVQASHVATNQIATRHIVGASISVADAASVGVNNGNGSWATVATVTLSLTDTVNGQNMPIVIGGTYGMHKASGLAFEVQVVMNGSLIFYDFVTDNADHTNRIFGGGSFVVGNGGTVTVTLQFQMNAAPGSFVIGGSILIGMGFKR